MNTTITLSPSTNGRIAITVGGATLATVKDGNGLIGQVDRKLRDAGIVRSGFAAVDGVMVATGRIVAPGTAR